MGKCSYCSAPENLAFDEETGTCRYCNNKWISEGYEDSEIYQEAANRRNKGLFDDAQELYNELLRKKPGDFLALWGKLLCKYGVVYIEKENECGQADKRVITCFRKVSDSFLDEYKQLEKIDRSSINSITLKERLQRNTEAKYIEKIQSKLREAGNQYDIFICYKETEFENEQGHRTEDSDKAERLYKILKKMGYRVFFAKEDLRGKAGADYEAVIFNAIESSKVMLVLGTKAEYLTSIWMKNEWTRFLWIQNEYIFRTQKEVKELIPIVDCRFDQLPEEFSRLQGFKWEIEERNDYSNLRFRLDELIPRKIPLFTGFEEMSDAQTVTKGLILQHEGKSEEAYNLFQKAAKNGNPEASYLLGSYYYNLENTSENNDMKKALETAFHWFKKSAEGGYPKAMWQLSFMYEMGLGTRADPANAKIWDRYYHSYERSQNI